MQALDRQHGNRRTWPAALRLHGPLILLLAARLALGLAYSQVVPPWEAYDEDGHFAYARYLAQHHSLLLAADDPAAAQVWEKFQPPLYYDLIAPVVAVFDHETTFHGPARNPYFTDGDAGVNYALHSANPAPDEASAEAALRAARAAGVLISTLSVLAVFLAARRLWPGHQGAIWLATVLYAFWPQFLFVGSMVTNDVLITALSAAALAVAVDLAVGGFRLRTALLLAGLVGASLLTKLNGAALIVLAIGALALGLRRRPAELGRVHGGRLALAVAGLALLVLVALWGLSSLHYVTGQVFQLTTLRDFANNLGSDHQSTAGLVGAALAYAFHTFLASYGWGNLETFGWLYGLWLAGSVLAVAGAGLALARLRRSTEAGTPRSVYLLLGLFAVTVIGLALSLAISQQSIYLVPGRYLLPALPAVALLLVAGWRALLPVAGLRRVGWQAGSVGLIVVGWLIPLRVLLPAYAPPRSSTIAQLATPIAAFFGSNLELLGYQGTLAGVAGDNMHVSLCWQALAPIASNDTLNLVIIGPDGQGYGNLHTFPGHGNYPTSDWAPNAPFCENYAIPIAAAIPAPSMAQLQVSWYSGTDQNTLPLRLASGETADDPAVTLPFKVSSPPGYVPAVQNATRYRLGGEIELTGYEVAADGDQVSVTLRWQALEDVQTQDAVFVHLRDTPDHAYAQSDSLPVQGAYPTQLWQKGETILDTHVLTLPPGGTTPPLSLYVGMYDAATQQRLPVLDADGQPVANNQIVLAQGLTFR